MDRLAPPTTRVADAMARGDWATLRLLIHPYVRWMTADGTSIRGRNQVMQHLQALGGDLPSPRSVELRDGQIYRWIS